MYICLLVQIHLFVSFGNNFYRFVEIYTKNDDRRKHCFVCVVKPVSFRTACTLVYFLSDQCRSISHQQPYAFDQLVSWNKCLCERLECSMSVIVKCIQLTILLMFIIHITHRMYNYKDILSTSYFASCGTET